MMPSSDHRAPLYGAIGNARVDGAGLPGRVHGRDAGAERDLDQRSRHGELLAGRCASSAGSGTCGGWWSVFPESPAPPVFQAEATLLVARTTAGFTQFGLSPVTAPPIDLGAYRVAASSDAVLEEALDLLGIEEPTHSQVRALRGGVTTSTEVGVRDSSLLRIVARDTSVASAETRANAVANALVAWDYRRSSESLVRVIETLERQIEALSDQVRALETDGQPDAEGQAAGLMRLRAEQQQQLGFARALVGSAQGLISVLQVADTTVRQVAPRPLTAAGVAALLAVVVYGLRLLRLALSTRLRDSEGIASVTGAPVLAEFPVSAGRSDPRLREAAAFARAGVLFKSVDVPQRVFAVTSSLQGEGKSVVASELAESFARYGYRTVLIDADLRSPSIIERFRVVGVKRRRRLALRRRPVLRSGLSLCMMPLGGSWHGEAVAGGRCDVMDLGWKRFRDA